jgi:DNA-binding IclR family transcriptional regulator
VYLSYSREILSTYRFFGLDVRPTESKESSIRGSTSAPTERVLAIVELLAQPGHERLRFSDVTRELDLTQATVHAILKTLWDRGWVSRDPVDKTFSLGPALAAVAERADATRSLAHAARAAAVALSTELGYPASVIERHGDSLVITAYEGADPTAPTAHPGERIPYAPPFGVAFAAWDTADGQRAWIQRTATANGALAEALEQALSRTRERGYDVDLTTPALAQTAQLMGALERDGMPAHVRPIMDQLLAETMVGFADEEAESPRPIATIAAPVFDHRDEVALILAVHPLAAPPPAQSAREVAAIGRRLVRAANEISGAAREPKRQPRP